MTGLGQRLTEAAVARKLEKNKARRAAAVMELAASRHELGKLIREGRSSNVAVTRLAEYAGIRRERCYDLFRGIDRTHRDVYANEEATP